MRRAVANARRASATIVVQPRCLAARQSASRGVDGAVHEQPRRRHVDLAEHLPVAEVEQRVARAADDLVGLLGELDAGLALLDEVLRARVLTLDDGEQHRAAAPFLDGGQAVEQVHSTFSTNTSISPPQGRPTFQPSSSEMP